MKDYKEVAESVFRMRDRYLEDKKRKKALVIKRMSVALSCCIVLLVGYGIWNSEMLRSVMPDRNENSDTHVIEEPDTGSIDITVTTTDGSAGYVVTTVTNAAPPDEVSTTAAVTDIPEAETTIIQAESNITTTSAADEQTAATAATTSGGTHRTTQTTTAAGGGSHHIRTTTSSDPTVRTTATRSAQTTRAGTTVTTSQRPQQTYVTYSTQTNVPIRTTTTVKIVTTHRTTHMTTTTLPVPLGPPGTTTAPLLGTTTRTAVDMQTTTTLGTTPPKYITHTELDGYDYYNREDSTLNLNKIGAKIGDGTASGYDEAVDDITSVPVHIYRARNMSEDYAVMVKYQDSDEFFYFVNNEYLPDTLGDLIDDTGMRYNGSTEYVFSRGPGDMTFGDAIGTFVDLLEPYRDLPVVFLKQEEEYGVDYSVYGAVEVSIYCCQTFTFDLNDEGYIQFKKHWYYDDEGNYIVPSIYIGPETVKSITDKMYSAAGGG
ncbi:MAG: hypothetical protein IJK31_02030 [Ruminococcus sp.]|nr:hypothetical protein [Ruminococcus sp.]